MSKNDRIFDILEFAQFVTVLREDVCAFFDKLPKEDSPLIRRSCVRAAFSFIEGCTHRMSRLIVSSESRNELLLTHVEKCILLETCPSIQNGEAKERTAFYSIRDRMKLVLNLFYGLVMPGDKPDYSNSGWRDLVQSVSVRDRITHPKTIDDYSVSDQEVQILSKGVLWFTNCIYDLAMKKATSTSEDRNNYNI